MEFKLINETKFKTEQLLNISLALAEGQSFPNFYLLCVSEQMNGLTLTNLDKPTIIIVIENLEQFAKVFVHELVHLGQHQNNYTDEDEAYDREIVISGGINNDK